MTVSSSALHGLRHWAPCTGHSVHWPFRAQARVNPVPLWGCPSHEKRPSSAVPSPRSSPCSTHPPVAGSTGKRACVREGRSPAPPPPHRAFYHIRPGKKEIALRRPPEHRVQEDARMSPALALLSPGLGGGPLPEPPSPHIHCRHMTPSPSQPGTSHSQNTTCGSHSLSRGFTHASPPLATFPRRSCTAPSRRPCRPPKCRCSPSPGSTGSRLGGLSPSCADRLTG